MAMNSSFTALPDDVLQRVLVGVALDDHVATAAACRAFRDVIRGPRFLRLRREYGFAERRILLVAHSDDEGHLEIRVPGKPCIVAASIPELRIDFGGTTTDGGARLFVSTAPTDAAPPYEIMAVDASARRWSRFATPPLNQRFHCTEWHGGLLYVAGGHVDGGVNRGYINTLHAFNETTGLWDDLPPMPHACASAASGVIGNELFIAGGRGVGNQALSTLQIYDFTTRLWRLGAPLPHARCAVCSIVVDGKLHLVPSRWSTGGVRRWLVYDVQSNTWTVQKRNRTIASDGAMHAFAHNGLIVGVHRHNLEFHHGTWNSGRGLGTPGIFHGVAGSVILG